MKAHGRNLMCKKHKIPAEAKQVQHVGLCRTICAGAARQVTVTVMPTQGLAAMTEAVANDITGYFQRHAVVRVQQADALSSMQCHGLCTALTLRWVCTQMPQLCADTECIKGDKPRGTFAMTITLTGCLGVQRLAMHESGLLTG